MVKFAKVGIGNGLFCRHRSQMHPNKGTAIKILKIHILAKWQSPLPVPISSIRISYGNESMKLPEIVIVDSPFPKTVNLANIWFNQS